ncbi:DUF4179 domain-containing protein [Gorillibacterium sp. sgz500922]|uniref:DUF4179 domain-containing protein n=1 Tax=Gorillibacterium sp. sgz500922 TaxID=3446694 RepID=UPI003F67B9A5
MPEEKGRRWTAGGEERSGAEKDGSGTSSRQELNLTEQEDDSASGGEERVRAEKVLASAGGVEDTLILAESDQDARGSGQGELGVDTPANPLSELRKEYGAIAIPAGLDGAVATGLARAKRRRRSRRRSRAAAWTAAAVLLLFIGSVRVSPVFASYLEKIPGMEGFVQFFSQDKGLQLAVDNDLLQKVDKADSHDGLTFRVDGVVADEARIVVFYTLKAEPGKAIPDSQTFNLQMYDESGSRIREGYVFSSGSSATEESEQTGKLEIEFDEATKARPVRLDITFSRQNEGIAFGPGFTVSFPLDTEKFAGLKREIAVNKAFESAGQKFVVEEAVFYPTRMKLTIRFDPANPLHIFGLTGLKLKDEEGRTWTTSTASLGTDRQTYFFESTYYTRPHRLTLEGTGVNALSEAERPIKLDLAGNRLISGPSNLLSADSVLDGAKRRITLRVRVSPGDNSGVSIEKATDGAGRVFETHLMETHSSTDSNDRDRELTFVFENGAEMKDTLTMIPSWFPALLESPFSVEFETPFK